METEGIIIHSISFLMEGVDNLLLQAGSAGNLGQPVLGAVVDRVCNEFLYITPVVSGANTYVWADLEPVFNVPIGPT